MTLGGQQRVSANGDPSPPYLPAALDPVATAFRPPPLPPDTVRRAALVDRLLAADAVPVVALVAPAGYGKTTVLAQWARRTRRRVTWVGLDRVPADGDADADAEGAGNGHSHGEGAALLASALAELSSSAPPLSLVLDQAERLGAGPRRRAVAELAARLPLGAQLVVAGRGEPPVPLALLRSRSQVLEVEPDDLAMDRREARELLDGAGVRVAEADLTRLLRRTEGWPVGLVLAAAVLEASTARGSRAPTPATVTGDDRLVAEYFRAEVLAPLPPEQEAFLLRTAVLDRLSVPLCDAVLGAAGSARVLDALDRARLFVVPLDRRRDWYRHHHLFGEFLRAELQRREPERVPDLHTRAAAWHEAQGAPDAAIAHADAAGDVDGVARLVASLLLSTDAAGGDPDLHRWLEWFDDRGLVERYPEVALPGACLHALAGDPAAAERWAAAAAGSIAAATAARRTDGATPAGATAAGAGESRAPGRELPDGSPTAAWSALLAALACRDGVAAMRADAETARKGLVSRSPWRALALLLEGLAHLLLGESEAADASLARAVEVAEHSGALFAGSLALAERSLVAAERHDWTAAEKLVDQARAMVRAGRLDDRAPGAVVRAVAARAAVHRGDDWHAGEDLVAAARVRSRLTRAVPTLAVQVRLELAAAHLERAEAAESRTLLREAADLLRTRPELGTLAERADTLRTKVEALRGRAAGASALTKAELRLLPFLSTHLSFREIAERLHVSRHTVKTQAMSVYRKLGASSRSEAIERVREIGLLDG